MAGGMSRPHLLAAVFVTSWITLFIRDAGGQEDTFNDFSLNPPYFNLAPGSGITATATCGQDEAGAPRSDLFCKLVGGPNYGIFTENIQGQFCDYCTSDDSDRAHPATNAIDGTERWWQSPPLSRGTAFNEVNLTLHFGQLFHVAYVLIKFANSPRPDLWVLERSVDNGRTFTPWQYFANSKRECIEQFGKEPSVRVSEDDDQLCTTEQSRIIPLENGEIVVSLINGRPGAKNFTYSSLLQDFTKATDIRLRFLRTNTLFGHLISKAQRDPTVTRRYYYSIKDISIGGRCVCHGHAQVCGRDRNRDNPNSLQCECQHNTCGESCDRCCPGFNQKPWRAATVDSANECQPCQCFSHASDCYYDPEVERKGASLDTFGRYSGGGVCINCQHNTAGGNCETCTEGFYRPYGVPPESPSGCTRCRCDGRKTAGCEMGSGRCICKPKFAGENCDRCADGYYNYPKCTRYPVYQTTTTTTTTTTTKSPAGPIVVPTACPTGYYFNSRGCQPCICDYRGTVSGICDASGRCLCRQGVEGERCDRCQSRDHSFPNCQACRCRGAGVAEGACSTNGQCSCLPNYVGQECDVCAPGYYGYPDCAACQCSPEGSSGSACDPLSGQCLCLPGVVGQRCDRCASGRRFPQCSDLTSVCNTAGTAVHNPQTGSCRCLPNVEGTLCNRCKPLYWNLNTENPHGCVACQCSPEGSSGSACDPLSGQCPCLPGVVGQRCDRCASGRRFPQCSDLTSVCSTAGTEVHNPQTGSCRCLPNVEGTLCNRCKPLYWNLNTENPHGCVECQCDLKGTLSGVGECEQRSGQCHCKPDVCGPSCNSCKDGYFQLQKKKYFGCQGCQCDVGGASGTACDQVSGQCQCRKNVIGPKCTEPASGYYFPTLHQLKFEVEDGTTPNTRPVRFGYNPQEFPDFSWRGYAIMSPAQSEVRVIVHVDPKDGRQNLFRVVLRFVNPSSVSVTGSIDATSNRGIPGKDHSKEIIFPPSASPSFLTVPGEGFAEPFAMNPGKWIIHIKAEGVLLDYLVLLPRDYYEASLLKEKITEPCTYLSTANKDANCLLYKHVAMDGFSSVLGSQGRVIDRRGQTRARRPRQARGRKPRQARVQRPSPDHPEMATLNGRQSQLELSLRVPSPGLYALVLEYASMVDNVQNVNILVSGQTDTQIFTRANIYSCAFSTLCRSVAVDNRNQVAIMQLTHRADILIQTFTTSFLLYKVFAVPAEEFSMEHVEPKELCVSTHGRFTEDSRYCVLRPFDKPSLALILHASSDGKLSSTSENALQLRANEDWQSGQFSVHEPQSDGALLKFPQTEIRFTPAVPLPAIYVVVVHYHQPEHVSFPVEVRIDTGRRWTGLINASFCPAVSGCREVVVADGRIALDFEKNSYQLPTISLIVPPKKTLILDYILLVPEGSYNPKLLREQPVDRSTQFKQQCRGEGFHIEPETSSQFCRDSARSLVAAFNDGALECNCDKSGSTGSVCDPAGGQCPCRPHVIGQRCTKCATGYYGFPYCRACECGLRLCDEVTGRCICPPQTVRPACSECQSQTFSFHPLLGCENCECSSSGISANAENQCDLNTGQCSCKPRIGGRKCDRCADGYYRFPECVPCDCDQGGVTSNVCHPDSGRCLCKKHVAGVRCDTCRDGSFYFDPSNPLGCTSCFCFGATDQCKSSKKRRGKFIEMQGWRLESPDVEEVPSVLNAASNTAVADVQELLPTAQRLHWVAPQSYLGDRVSSYGGFLTYQSKSFGIPSEGMTLMDRQADVVLKGQDMSLIHMAPHVPIPDRLYQGRIQLLEENWRHADTNRPVSREELMTVLAGLVGLKIRALYFTQTQRLSLGEVGLEEATTSGTGSPANTVELCSCPPKFTGDSCEKCAPGFYRDGSGPYLGRCVPCECNGLADKCEDRTGRCLNCKFNTAGDRCERCKEGYYGNAVQRSCKVCPCPFSSNSFAVGCREVYGEMQCVCKTGYTGDRCESCAPGYYGEPLTPGGRCRPCNCNGNGNSCDPRTGVCKNSFEPGDTDTDANCQECDSCAQTLLEDLEKVDVDLARIKAHLDNASASASSKESLEKLEKAVSETKVLVNKYSYSINKQKSRVDQMEDDMTNLKGDINSLKDKADQTDADADKAVAQVKKTHKRAKDLDSEIQNMLKKIQELLDKLNNEGNRGDALPNDSLGKMLEDAQRMVKEMEKRNFTPQKTSAEKERDEAKKLLDHIKTDVSKQCDQNEAAAEKLRDLLTDYTAKLEDLDKALKEASNLVKKANAQNGLNSQTLRDLQKRVEKLKKERKTVEDQMAMAEDELQKTEDLLQKLSDSKLEYEQLGAQLDGAKTDLTKKVNEIVKAAGKKDIVEDAEEHARMLSKLAQELENSVKNASGLSEVRDAKDAIDAYKNITDAINAAEAAANEAKDAADNALNNIKKQKLTQRAKDLKKTGDDLLSTAEDATKDLQGASSNLTDLKKRLTQADKKKRDLERDLLDAQNQLNNINRDDIGDMIAEAKRKAASANDTAADTMDRLNTIIKEVDKISTSPVDSNLSSVLDNVDQSVKDLLNTIPSLNDKISEVENLTSEFSPISNISENIKKIKELIEEARDAANRITVPMNFGGDAYVELRPPTNVDELKAYTSLSLSLQRPEGRGDGRRRRQTRDDTDMFVLYLGNRDSSKNYIGMALRKNILYVVYKLNGVEYEMKSGYISKSAPEPAKFDRVDLRRIYQDMELTLTKDFTSGSPGQPLQGTNQGVEKKDLLNISPNDIVFYVGGHPADFTPPASIKYPKYKGCIEFSSFNDKVVSLYNFQKAESINRAIPCKRYVPPMDSDYYEGTGYARVNIDRMSSFFMVEMSIFTRSENGLLFYVGKEDDYLALTMEKGVLFIHSNKIDAPATKNVKKFPVTEWTEVRILITKPGKVTVRMGSEVLAEVQGDFMKDYKEFYIGGLPQDLRERGNITMQPFKGCLKNMKLNQRYKPLDEQVGVSKGCPTDALVSRKAQFSLGSSLSAPNHVTMTGNVSISLGFKSTESNGLILENKHMADGIKLALENGYVILNFNEKQWKSNKQYQDGQWHYLTITKGAGRIEMHIDDEDNCQQQKDDPYTPTGGNMLSLGNKKFKGCISNLYTRRPEKLYQPEDLSYFTASGDVLSDVCTAESPIQLMLDRGSKRDGATQMVNESLSVCSLPAQVQHAYHMGGAVSSLTYSLPLQVLQPRPHFSLDVRTRSPEGLLFFAGTRGGQSHLALYMSKGRIRLSVGKQREIFNREKYNDGKWHSVIFSLERKKFKLVVDGIRAQDGQLYKSEIIPIHQFVSPVYLGSGPASLHKELKSKALPKHSVTGCVRNFKMNGALMSHPAANYGAGPCFEGQTQRGAYFPGNGAHVVINNSFAVNSAFELLFSIRPRSQTGLLLHIGESSRTPYGPATGGFFTVYMLRGEVVAKVNNGRGEFMVSVKPKASLCDGTSHKISVIKRKNVVQLSVDTLDDYKIGPPSSSMALTKEPLYVGGIPEMLMQQLLPVTSSFVGCIQDMKINDEPVSFDVPSAVFGPVNLRECPG